MKKLLSLLSLTLCTAVMLSSYACAYIDPSVMTYTIQAIAGVVIAVGAVAGLYWRRAKKKVSQKLGIDENRNKEVESDVLEIKEEACSAKKRREILLAAFTYSPLLSVRKDRPEGGPSRSLSSFSPGARYL